MAVQYTVKPGDNLSTIGSQFGLNYNQSVSSAYISGYKSGNPNLISPGEVLTINQPGKAPAAASSVPTYSNKDDVTKDLNSFQSQYLSNTVPGVSASSGSWTPDQLAQVLQSKGYNATDAKNMATGARAPELAKEYGLIAPTAQDKLNQYKSILPDPNSAPKAPNLEAAYGQLSQDAGLDGLQTDINDLTLQEQDTYARLRQRTDAEKGKPVAMNVIEGRVSEEQKQEQENLDFIQRTKEYKINQYNSALNNIKFIMDLKQTDFQLASQEYDTKYKQAMDTITLMRGIEQDQATAQQRAVDNARANLQIFINAAKDGGINVATMSADQRTQLNKLEVQSGLPIGFTASIRKDPKADIIFTNSNEGVTQVGIRNPDGTITVQSYGTKTATASEKSNATYQSIVAQLNKSKGSDGFVNTGVYTTLKNQYPDVFKSYVSPEEWLNPKDATAQKYLQTSTQALNANSTGSATDINKAKQLIIQNGGTAADQKQVETDPNFRNWVIAIYG